MAETVQPPSLLAAPTQEDQSVLNELKRQCKQPGYNPERKPLFAAWEKLVALGHGGQEAMIMVTRAENEGLFG